ncbi:hypothetical protein [Burkholderia sp. BDU5]|uniref:hypothetical protein n=1 Tax=Burkholderia sp. BDU5 TaxID=1385590 RepID=UPI0012E350FD|nr:hypothetical protein [Burkholderia sp. BDU5]
MGASGAKRSFYCNAQIRRSRPGGEGTAGAAIFDASPLASCLFCRLPPAALPICRLADLPPCHLATLPICRFADLPICRFADLPICRFAALPIRPIAPNPQSVHAQNASISAAICSGWS